MTAILRTYLGLYLAFLFGPIVVIALFSFNASSSLNFPITAFSLRWYDQLFQSPDFLDAFYNSIKVGLATSLITTVLGTFSALALIRLPGRYRSYFEFLNIAPIAFPGLFVGIALVILFSLTGVIRSLVTVTIAHVVFTLPFFVQTIRSRVVYFDSSLEEAARDLGATKMQTYRLITIPILRPTIIGAAILTFALSFDEAIITIFVSGNASTTPLYLWSLLRRTVDPSLNAASVLILMFTLILLTIGGLLFWMQQKRALAARLENE